MYLLPNDGEYDLHPTHQEREEVVFDENTQKTKEITIPASKNIDLINSVLTWTG